MKGVKHLMVASTICVTVTSGINLKSHQQNNNPIDSETANAM